MITPPLEMAATLRYAIIALLPPPHCQVVTQYVCTADTVAATYALLRVMG